MEPQVFKILTGPQWALWRELGITYGSHDDKRDGFIHFSAAKQAAGTLSKHFASHDRVWLVEGHASRMGHTLMWENSRGGQLFPHLYAPFTLAMAGREWPLRKIAGTWRLPQEVAQ